MERAISTINQFKLSKDQIEVFSSHVLNELHNHGGDVLQTAICLNAMETIVKKIKQGISDLVKDEAEKYGEKTFDYGGAKITKSNRATYDYSGSEIWKDLSEQKSKLEALMKTIDAPVADPETGEIIPPAIKKVSESISITIN